MYIFIYNNQNIITIVPKGKEVCSMTRNHWETLLCLQEMDPPLFPNGLRFRLVGGELLQKVWIGGIANTPRGEILPKEWDPDYYNSTFPRKSIHFPWSRFYKIVNIFHIEVWDPPNSSLTPGWKWNKEMESFFMFCPCVSKKEDKKRVLPLVYFVSCSVKSERQRQRRRQIRSVSPVVWIVSCSVPGCQLQAEEDIACPATKQNILINLYEGGAKTEIKSG